ncbi:hypothetical protein [Streptomyces spororaveus]|uniref:hypothetical protein n=1 Tax=Streptomyces spororaveus TaxID=284039 RepID=UPI001924347F|nr:hypothetical protein [Streptomyces spororaveus]
MLSPPRDRPRFRRWSAEGTWDRLLAHVQPRRRSSTARTSQAAKEYVREINTALVP